MQRPLVDVALLVLPESAPGALMSLREVLGAAGTIWGAVTGTGGGTPVFRPRLVSRDGCPVRSPAGPLLDVEARLPRTTDVVVVTDLYVDLAADPRGRWPDEEAYLRRVHRDGALVASICSGTALAAASGLLDGLEATSHWSMGPMFTAHFPAVIHRPERILCPAGPEHRIVTAGGASSWEELALYLVARYAGEEEARRVAKVFVLGDKSAGQLPFAAMARPRQHEDGAIAAAQRWLAHNYAAPAPVAAMAAEAGLAERTFSRRFRKATGYGPVEYVQALRLEEAKQMLETTREPVDAVAAAVGYADPVFFRRIFKRSVGVTPARYRQRFAAVGTAGAARSD
jgi:transcriptional regulator GlxA family with amidase domain